VAAIAGLLLSPKPRPPVRAEDVAFNGARTYGYLNDLCKLGPRRSGSPAMAAQQKLLVEHFEKLGGRVELQRFSVPHPQTGELVPMANIIVRWNPAARRRILLCAHYDTLPFPMQDPVDRRGPFVGANDNASGVAILMELAHDLPALNLSCGVDFVLFDAEEFIFSDKDRFFLGSEYFAGEYARDHKDYQYSCAVLLDMVGQTDLHIFQEVNSMLWADSRPVVEQIWATAERLGVEEFIPQPKHEVRDDHVPLHDMAGIPACDIIDFDYSPWHTQADTPDKCSPQSLAKVGWVLREWLKEAGRSAP
jgi:hypothetical protein